MSDFTEEKGKGLSMLEAIDDEHYSSDLDEDFDPDSVVEQESDDESSDDELQEDGEDLVMKLDEEEEDDPTELNDLVADARKHLGMWQKGGHPIPKEHMPGSMDTAMDTS